MYRSLIWVVVAVAGLLGCKPSLQPVIAPASPTASAPIEPTPVAKPQTVPTSAPTSVPTAVPSLTEEKSGLTFTATLGPTCPGPQRVGQVCTAPYAGEFIVTRMDGSEAARFNTDVDGRAVVDLPVGNYSVSIAAGGGRSLPRGGPVEVVVTAGQYVEVVLELDTGMR